jgi:hypothetical protein
LTVDGAHNFLGTPSDCPNQRAIHTSGQMGFDIQGQPLYDEANHKELSHERLTFGIADF